MRITRDARTAKRLLEAGTPLVAFDTETTGLDCNNDYVIEIGAVRFGKDGVAGKPFNALIKPPVAIPSIITDITGLTDADVANAKSAAEVLPRFLEYIDASSLANTNGSTVSQGVVLVAHNAQFDMGFVGTELRRANLSPLEDVAIGVADTLDMARRLWPGLPKGGYKLSTLSSKCGINAARSHRAEDDATTCAMLFLHMALCNTEAV